jgi:hypothetical protein
VVRQRLGDVREQSAGDQRAAAVGDRRRDTDLSRDLVVESGDRQRIVRLRVEQHATQHGNRRTRRKAASDPGDSVGEAVAFDADLHEASFPRQSTCPTTTTCQWGLGSLDLG